MRESHSHLLRTFVAVSWRQQQEVRGTLGRMFLRNSARWVCSGVAFGLAGLAIAGAQQEKHARGYKPLPPTAAVVVTVEKGFNSKPLPNASVVFRAVRDDKITANLETKTDPDGRASLDLLEVGSHVTVQVIAGGFATYAADFDLTNEGKQILVKLERPRAQISRYTDNTDKPAMVQPGIQERQKPAPATATPASAASPTAPLQTVPPVVTPSNTQTPSTPGTPQ